MVVRLLTTAGTRLGFAPQVSFMNRMWTIALLILVIASMSVTAQEGEANIVISRDSAPDWGAVALTEIASGFTRPVFVTHADDGSNRFFVVEQGGKIWIVEDGAASREPFLDISHLITPIGLTAEFTEQGLLGLAFHPHFRSNGLFFVDYTDHEGATIVERYHVSASNPNSAELNSASIVFQLPQPFVAHNGGQIAFGPDGYLYIALGDGGDANDPLGAGQNRKILLGSILRIDIDNAQPYAIPPDNPFVGDDGALDEIWSYGLRNPWRFSFDRLTGDMYIGDVGQHAWEEFNFQPASSTSGENYGWSAFEGSREFAGGVAPNHVPPFFEYDHSQGCSAIGGYVYRGEAIPHLQGVYLSADWCNGRIFVSWRDKDLNWHSELFNRTELKISSLGEDELGELYIVDYDGKLYRFDPAGD